MPPELSSLPVFTGKFRHTMDPKHRFSIPSCWRRQDEKDEYFLLPAQSDDHLVGYPPPEFAKFGRLVSENPAIPQVDKRKFMRQLYSRSQRCGVDSNGRLLLPDELCRAAGLSTDLWLIGINTGFEVWSPDRWDDAERDDQPIFSQVADLIGL